MKKTLLITALLGATALQAKLNISAQEAADNKYFIQNKRFESNLIAEAKKVFHGFSHEVRVAMHEAAKKDNNTMFGISAVKACSNNAEDMTKAYNAKLEKNVRFYRTALKYRNPNNKPDQKDIEVMKEIEGQIANEQLGNLTRTKSQMPRVVKIDKSTYRVYKPLKVTHVCAKCHGTHVDAKYQAIIKEHYPKDLAINMKEGSLRGVMVAEFSDQTPPKKEIVKEETKR